MERVRLNKPKTTRVRIDKPRSKRVRLKKPQRGCKLNTDMWPICPTAKFSEDRVHMYTLKEAIAATENSNIKDFEVIDFVTNRLTYSAACSRLIKQYNEFWVLRPGGVAGRWIAIHPNRDPDQIRVQDLPALLECIVRAPINTH